MAVATAWPATGAALAAMIALGRVIWPQAAARVGDTREPTEILASARDRDAVPEDRLAQLAAEQSRLERIVAAKWRLLRAAIGCTGLALALGAATVAIASLT